MLRCIANGRVWRKLIEETAIVLEPVRREESTIEPRSDVIQQVKTVRHGGPNLDPVWIWGVPFVPWTMEQTIAVIDDLIAIRRPSFFITANVNYAMLTGETADLRMINGRAAFILADGEPIVWASRWARTPLPERVAGSDLIFRLSEHAARKGHRMFLLGGAKGVAEEAARRLVSRYPGLQIVGVECPPFREATSEEEAALVRRIREAQPDLLFVAFGQPKGERWIIRHFGELNVPVSVQVGASLDFAAKRVSRAPRWMQKTGLEWAFRMVLEPKRMIGRYTRNAWFIVRMVVNDLPQRGRQSGKT